MNLEDIRKGDKEEKASIKDIKDGTKNNTRKDLHLSQRRDSVTDSVLYTSSSNSTGYLEEVSYAGEAVAAVVGKNSKSKKKSCPNSVDSNADVAIANGIAAESMVESNEETNVEAMSGIFSGERVQKAELSEKNVEKSTEVAPKDECPVDNRPETKKKKRNRKPRKKHKKKQEGEENGDNGSSKEGSSVVEESVCNSIRTNLFGENIGSQPGQCSSAENIDGLELANVMQMKYESEKYQTSIENKRLRDFYSCIVNGKSEDFEWYFSLVCNVLIKLEPRFGKIKLEKLINFVMAQLVHNFCIPEANISILHLLAAKGSNGVPCGKEKHHECLLIRGILDHLTRASRLNALQMRTAKTGKTALHIAAACGEKCQVEAFLNYEITADELDASGRAPIHYAVMRNNLTIVKDLMWYGADLSLKERNASPVELAAMNPQTEQVYDYLYARMNALEGAFKRWVCKYVKGLYEPVNALSELHFSKLLQEMDYRYCLDEDGVYGIRQFNLNMNICASKSLVSEGCTHSLLFVIPTFYKPDERYADAANPQIFATDFIGSDNRTIRVLSSHLLLRGAQQCFHVECVLKGRFLAYLYVYELPLNLERGAYTLNAVINTSGIKDAEHITFAYQAFACTVPPISYPERSKKGFLSFKGKTLE